MDPEDYLMLSGIQHFAFCKRQWALIHVDGQWQENLRTAQGRIIHKAAHDDSFTESRKDCLICRGMRVQSPSMGVSGELDVVEFHRNAIGVKLTGKDGIWQPVPIEYKRGKPKANPADRLQLCAEAMCLEEMLGCFIPEGFLYYHEIRRREPVALSDSLREEVRAAYKEMHELLSKGQLPRVKPEKHCNACSLKQICMPFIYKKQNVAAYYARRLEEDE